MDASILIQQIAFLLLLGVAGYIFFRNISRIRDNIMVGKNAQLEGKPSLRWKRLVLNALGQKKMFKRPIPALLHLLVYVGFIIINIEILEIIIEGLFGAHRVFLPLLGNIYPAFITAFEFLAVLVLISVIVFLVRRWFWPISRFRSKDLKGWPQLDAQLILFFEVFLMSAFLLMNASDLALQSKGYGHYAATGSFFFSGILSPLLDGLQPATLVAIERGAWWAHIIGIFVFLNYLPFSKHLHIIFAFPNTYYSRQYPQGVMQNMPVVENEVRAMLNPDSALAPEDLPPPPETFGVKDVPDLEWRDVLAAYTCTECGRCTDMCPANQTGKLLSPRKIMMDTRDRAEAIGDLKRGKEGVVDKPLYGGYISREEIMACTTCQACVEACPANIHPLAIINGIRRHIIMDEADSPAQWNVMFNNIENNQAPWQSPASDRANWITELEEEKA